MDLLVHIIDFLVQACNVILPVVFLSNDSIDFSVVGVQSGVFPLEVVDLVSSSLRCGLTDFDLVFERRDLGLLGVEGGGVLFYAVDQLAAFCRHVHLRLTLLLK